MIVKEEPFVLEEVEEITSAKHHIALFVQFVKALPCESSHIVKFCLH